jgi:asparagine synthase (glutamine-hydrolysing)
MSGFAGIVRSDGARPDAKLLEQMAASLAFRGPDGTQVWTHPGAGFCFTLLATGPSSQAPTQPCSLDRRVWLLGDARLDGREDLRRRLEQHGEKASANASNEELILRAWRQWAEKSFELLVGDFAFALWDEEAKYLWCVRDLMGAKPFFYARTAGEFVFSNTLSVVRLSPEVSAKLDLHFIGDFLLQSWCPDVERTAFQDVRRLPAGHALRYSNGEVRVRRYGTLPVEQPLYLKRSEEYVEQFLAHLEEAVCDRLPDFYEWRAGLDKRRGHRKQSAGRQRRAGFRSRLHHRLLPSFLGRGGHSRHNGRTAPGHPDRRPLGCRVSAPRRMAGGVA